MPLNINRLIHMMPSSSRVGEGDGYNRGEIFRWAIKRGYNQLVLGELEQGNYDLNSLFLKEGCKLLLHWSAELIEKDKYLMNSNGGSEDRLLQQRQDILSTLIEYGAWTWKVCLNTRSSLDYMGEEGKCHREINNLVRPWDVTRHVATKRMLMKGCIDQFKKHLEGTDNMNSCTTESYYYGMKEAALCAAAYLGDIDTMRLAVKDGADVEDDACGYTPLSITASHGTIESVRVLVEELSAKVDHNIKEHTMTALTVAIRYGKEKVVGYLIDQGADVYLAYFACRTAFEGLTPAIFLCDNNVVVHHVRRAMVAKIPEICNHKSKRYQEFAFRVFVGLGYIEGLCILLTAGAELPVWILQQVVEFGQTDVLGYLISEGALKT